MAGAQIIVSDVHLVNQATQEETRISGEMTFGRADVDKIYPQDTRISRRHFRIVVSADGVFIEDLGSTNRTKVNGVPLKPKTLYRLKSRDLIEFGQQKVMIFIDGKIQADQAELMSEIPETDDAVERSLVFERVCLPGGGEEIREMNVDVTAVHDLDSVQSGPALNEETILQGLVERKNAAWYLQFGGSEFGPLSFKELKVLSSTKQFEGGILFAFTEGLAEWLPVEKLQKFFESPVSEYTATQRIGGGTPFSGTVSFLPDRKISGKCEAISLSEITVRIPNAPEFKSAFSEIEVKPASASGMEPFKAQIKIDPSRSSGTLFTLVITQASPSVKMAIERYLRAIG